MKPARKIVALCGSLRQDSSNGRLLEAARRLAPAGCNVEIFDGIGELPHFNPDLDAPGAPVPASVQKLRDAFTDAQALLISTPEYAHGIPGAFKNALDWLVSTPTFVDLPTGVIVGSSSDGGHAQNSLLEVLRTMSAKLVPNALVAVPGVRTQIDEHGRVQDPELVSAIESVLRALLAAD